MPQLAGADGEIDLHQDRRATNFAAKAPLDDIEEVTVFEPARQGGFLPLLSQCRFAEGPFAFRDEVMNLLGTGN